MAKSGTRRFTIEYKSTGQPRPYADHIYDFTITVEWIPYGKDDWELNELAYEIIERHARASQNWHDKPEWHQPRLWSKSHVNKGVWQFIVIQPFLD